MAPLTPSPIVLLNAPLKTHHCHQFYGSLTTRFITLHTNVMASPLRRASLRAKPPPPSQSSDRPPRPPFVRRGPPALCRARRRGRVVKGARYSGSPSTKLKAHMASPYSVAVVITCHPFSPAINNPSRPLLFAGSDALASRRSPAILVSALPTLDYSISTTPSLLSRSGRLFPLSGPFTGPCPAHYRFPGRPT